MISAMVKIVAVIVAGAVLVSIIQSIRGVPLVLVVHETTVTARVSVFP